MKPFRTTMGAGAFAAALSLTACSTADSPPATPPAPSNQDTAMPTPAASDSPSDTTTPSAPSDAIQYRDGEYTATGWYGSLPSHQDVTLTIQDQSVVAVEITTPAEDSTSLGYQERFADALPEAVVGRNVDELLVDKVAGSSGCSEGFMNALAEIKQAAAA